MSLYRQLRISEGSHHGSTWLVYITFVVYGSLLPFEFNNLHLWEAYALFTNIPMLRLGVESRADWIANGVLYIPVGFLTVQYIRHWKWRLPNPFVVLISILVSVGLALSVEFAQIYFPARTVSQNDLVAEAIGSVAGALLAITTSRWYETLLLSLTSQSSKLKRNFLEGFTFIYIAFCLFPYDFLISSAELHQKLSTESWGILLAGSNSPSSIILSLAKLTLETALTIPIGMLVARISKRKSITNTAILGFGFGLTIEILQLFMSSGTAQGLSIASRSIGFILGSKLNFSTENYSKESFRQWLTDWKTIIFTIYFMALTWASGWYSSNFNNINQAIKELVENTRFLPFYYHYFTTEAKALESLGSISLLYAPIGVFSWALRKSPRFVGFMAVMMATTMEGSKLFLHEKHPDPTNILIATISAFLIYKLISLEIGTIQSMPTDNASQATLKETPKFKFYLPLISSVSLLYLASDLPSAGAFLAILFTLYGLLIWKRPDLIFFAIPAALPTLDLAPFTGRFYLDEFDLLIALSVCICFAKTNNISLIRTINHKHSLTLFLFTSSVIISTFIALFPWQAIEANSFSSYLTNFNSIRIAKGFLWSLPLLYLAKRFYTSGINIEKQFSNGLIIGLTGTVGFIIIERIAFTGLLDFSVAHRAVGPFSAIHIGGAYIECFLVVALPFLVKALANSTSRSSIIAYSTLVVLTTYSVLVTFSRGGYLALAIVFIIYIIHSLANRRKLSGRQHTFAWLAIFASILISIPILLGKFAQNRIDNIDADLETRRLHWKKTISMVDGSLSKQLFGMGVGSFPATYQLYNQDEIRSGSYRLIHEDTISFIRLAVGNDLYIDQWIPNHNSSSKPKISVMARSSSANASFSISICQKWLLASVNCAIQALTIGTPNKWEKSEFLLPTTDSGIFAPYFISLNNTASVAVDLTDIQISHDNNLNLLKNSQFKHGLDYWFFQADEHLPWHAKNLPLALYFDQGLFGIILFLVLIGEGLFYVLKAGKIHWALSIISFIIIGLFDSLVDAPRFALLIMLLACLPKLLRPTLSPPHSGSILHTHPIPPT